MVFGEYNLLLLYRTIIEFTLRKRFKQLIYMVSPARFERATYALGGRRAIQLCHGDMVYKSIGWIESI